MITGSTEAAICLQVMESKCVGFQDDNLVDLDLTGHDHAPSLSACRP